MKNVEEILRDLVSFNTIKDKQNKEIIDYIENILKYIGFKTEKKDKYIILSNKDDIGLGFVRTY